MTKKFHIYVFSYNRADFLLNCLMSIKYSTDIPVTIIDDESDDEETKNTLRELNKTHSVISIKKDSNREGRTGGLHNNMNFAISHADRHKVDYAIFIQDDMQFVRALHTSDLLRVEEFFKNHNSIVLNSCFLKSAFEKHESHRMQINECKGFYIRKTIGPGMFHFSDVGVFDVKRVKSTFGKFEIGESSNEDKAAVLELDLGFNAYPFMMWLPFPKSFRNGKSGVWHSLMERVSGAGFHPINIMDDSEVRLFLNRAEEELPYAERFLLSPTSPRQCLWSPEGGVSNLLCRGGWRKLLGMMVLKVNNIL